MQSCLPENFDPSKYSANDMSKAHFLMYETLLCDPINQILGFTHVADMEGANMQQIKIWNMSEFTRVFKWAEQSLPMRHKAIHVGR